MFAPVPWVRPIFCHRRIGIDRSRMTNRSSAAAGSRSGRSRVRREDVGDGSAAEDGRANRRDGERREEDPRLGERPGGAGPVAGPRRVGGGSLVKRGLSRNLRLGEMRSRAAAGTGLDSPRSMTVLRRVRGCGPNLGGVSGLWPPRPQSPGLLGLVESLSGLGKIATRSKGRADEAASF
jgi:hypothetical protein